MSRGCIFVVENDPSMLDGFRTILELDDYQVLTAANAAEGLGILRSRAQPPDLILSSMMLPTENEGIRFIREIRQESRWAAVPIVLLIWHQSKSDIQQETHRGVDDFLISPVNPEELLEVIGSRLTRGRALAAESAADEISPADDSEIDYRGTPDAPKPSSGEPSSSTGQLDWHLPDLGLALKFPDNPKEKFKGIHLSPEEWRVVALVNPKNTIQQIAQANNMTDIEIRRIVSSLQQAGLVELVTPPAGEAAPPGTAAPATPPMRGMPTAGKQSEAPAAASAVQFSAYYPKEIALNEWQSLRAYVFRQAAADAVAADAQKELGNLMFAMRRVADIARQTIQEGATITATPTLAGFQFNPPSVSVGFYEDWHRFDFKLRAATAPLNQATNGALTFTVEGLIVADIPLSIYVGAAGMAKSVGTSNLASATQALYNAIFASYSHQDTQIVERVERAYKALGLDFLRDVESLKSGENWSVELLNLIDKADIFQLFWSHAAAESDHVRSEWEYALQLVNDQRKPPTFIRPVYWEQPMPPAPEALKQIHFAPEPELKA